LPGTTLKHEAYKGEVVKITILVNTFILIYTTFTFLFLSFLQIYMMDIGETMYLFGDYNLMAIVSFSMNIICPI
jgi:hypothetical protein